MRVRKLSSHVKLTLILLLSAITGYTTATPKLSDTRDCRQNLSFMRLLGDINVRQTSIHSYEHNWREDTGNYSCIAENSHGLGESNNVSVTVNFIPTCRNSKPEVIQMHVHQSIDLECTMSARPGNVSFSWLMTQNNNNNSSQVFEVITFFVLHQYRTFYHPRYPQVSLLNMRQSQFWPTPHVLLLTLVK